MHSLKFLFNSLYCDRSNPSEQLIKVKLANSPEGLMVEVYSEFYLKIFQSVIGDTLGYHIFKRQRIKFSQINLRINYKN